MVIQVLLGVVCSFYIVVGFTGEAIAGNATNDSYVNKRQKMIVKKVEQDVEKIIAEQPIKTIALTNAQEPGFDKAKALFERACDYQGKEDYSHAIDLYTNTTLVCSELYEPYYNMALCYEKLNNKNEAIKCYEKAASLNRFYKPIFFNLGKLYSEQGNEPKAATNWAIYNQM